MVEVVIASAGPAVNVAIAGVIFVVSTGAVLAPGASFGLRLLSVLFWANLILAGFISCRPSLWTGGESSVDC